MRNILAVIATIFGLFLFGYVFFSLESAPELAYRPVDVGGGAIIVENQFDMNKVILDAEIAVSGFISIHESMSGAPAANIGVSRLLEPGDYEGLEIALRQPMIPGYRYIALLIVDNGNGVFELGIDLPVMVEGAVVRPDFIAELR
jgi:hypothetical protein